MKRIILIALCLMCFAGTASAYGVYLSCPESIQVGLPLKCSIDSDFPPGRVLDIVFYRMQDTSTEVNRQSFTVQDNKITQYKFIDTTGLPGGNYKVEVQYTSSGEPNLRSDSKTLQLVKLIGSSSVTAVPTTLPTSAYGVYLSCPESVQVGLPLKCSIDSGDFPPEAVFDIVFYQMTYSATEVSRSPVWFREGQLTQYKFFDTTNLPGGNYKVEVQFTSSGKTNLRSDSKTLQLVKLIGSSSETAVPTPVPTTAITTVPTTIFTTQHTTAITTGPTTTSTTVPTPTITTEQTTIVTTIPTTVPTIVQTTSLTTASTPNYDAKIAALESQLAVQNQKIEEQGNILDKITSFLRNIFGWK